MNFKAIILNVGRALLVSALFMFLSLCVSFFEGLDDGFVPLAISCLITTIIAVFPFIFIRRNEPLSNLSDGFVTIVLAWFLAFIFGMLPYVLYGGEFTLINAWFESVSGLTTTGATILKDVEALPKSILFWRSSTHFIGGLGVVVFLLLILPQASGVKFKLTNIEMSSLSNEGYKYKSSRTANVILIVYLAMNVMCFCLFVLTGMSPFDAITHAFSVCATGGFSTKAQSLGSFHSPWVAVVAMIFMLTSSMHLGLVYASVTKASIKPLWRHPVTRYYLGGLVIATLVIFVALQAMEEDTSLPRVALQSAFTAISYVTTSGFGIVDNAHWPLYATYILMILSLQCACAGSTSGGLKADRVLIAFKGIKRIAMQIAHPSSVTKVHYGKSVVSDADVMNVFAYITLYFIILLVSISLNMAIGVNGTEAISGSICTLGNVGAALGDMSVLGTYADQPIASKFIYSCNMFLGRMEIYPILVVARLIFNRR